MNERSAREDLVTGQYLSFHLAGEEYAVNILDVQEIKCWQPVTRIPNVPTHVLGVINLRGLVVPVMDLRRRFGLPPKTIDAASVVIVLHVRHHGGFRTVGLLVDAVDTVYNLNADVLREVPEVGSRIDAAFLCGLATVDERMLILLDVPALVNDGLLAADALPPTAAVA